MEILEAKADLSPNGQLHAAHLRLSGLLRCFRELDGGAEKKVSIARLWSADDGINASNEALWALLIARMGGSDLKETASGIELSTKDIGLILAANDENETTFQRRGYFEADFCTSDNCHFFRGSVAKDVKAVTFI